MSQQILAAENPIANIRKKREAAAKRGDKDAVAYWSERLRDALSKGPAPGARNRIKFTSMAASTQAALKAGLAAISAARNVIEAGKCPESGCVKEVGGKWRVISNRTGKLWPAEYETKEDAQGAIAAYHMRKKGIPPK